MSHPADDRFVHGLLGSLDPQEDAARERRLARLRDALDGAEVPHASRNRRWLAAAAAIIVLVTAGGFVWIGSRPSARTLIDQAIAASEGAPSRRYEISVHLVSEDAAPSVTGELDLVGGEAALIRAHAHGHDLKAGRDGSGSWYVDVHGDVKRVGKEHPWPRWLRIGAAKVLVDAVDDLLPGLHRDYDLTRPDTRELDGRRYTHVRAESRGSSDLSPGRVDVWFDPETHLVVRMELRWTGHAHAHRHGAEPHATHPKMPPHVLHEHLHRMAGLTGPRLMIFELAGTPDFPEGWFRPEAHIE